MNNLLAVHKESQQLINELTYQSYRYNRLRRLDIPYQQWGCIFGNVEELENRLQAEIAG